MAIISQSIHHRLREETEKGIYPSAQFFIIGIENPFRPVSVALTFKCRPQINLRQIQREYLWYILVVSFCPAKPLLLPQHPVIVVCVKCVPIGSWFWALDLQMVILFRKVVETSGDEVGHWGWAVMSEVMRERLCVLHVAELLATYGENDRLLRCASKRQRNYIRGESRAI